MSATLQPAMPDNQPTLSEPAPLDEPLNDAIDVDTETLSSVDEFAVDDVAATAEDAGSVEPTANAEKPGVKKHARFFYEGSFITFLVEGTLYRVHDYLFSNHSPYWAKRVSDGALGDAPIELEDVTARDMDALLTLLYNCNFYGYGIEEDGEWESVLRLSTRWSFPDVRDIAIDSLKGVPPFKKLTLARAFDIPGWLEPAFVDLCMRKESLTLEEIKQLSMEDIAAITAAREAVRQKAQIAVDKKEVSEYVAKNILHTAATAPESQSTPPATSASPASLAVQNTDPSTQVSSQPAPAAAVPEIVKPIVLSAKPSADEVNQLVAALLKEDFDSAIAMVALESAQVFADVLKDFTAIWKSRAQTNKLIDAILSNGAKRAPFIPIGIQLLSVLPAAVAQYPNSYGCRTETLKSILYYRSQSATTIHQAITRIRTHYNFALALQHADVTTHGGTSEPYFDILGKKSRTESIHDKRSANLLSFYKQLAKAGMVQRD